MLALEPVRGIRVVADASALDTLVVVEGAIVLRFAPDEALVIFAKPGGELDERFSNAIVVEEAGFVGCWLTPAQLRTDVLPHVDWQLPDPRPTLAQGFVAGVPARLWLESDRALLLCAAPYAHELAERLR